MLPQAKREALSRGGASQDVELLMFDSPGWIRTSDHPIKNRMVVEAAQIATHDRGLFDDGRRARRTSSNAPSAHAAGGAIEHGSAGGIRADAAARIQITAPANR